MLSIIISLFYIGRGSSIYDTLDIMPVLIIVENNLNKSGHFYNQYYRNLLVEVRALKNKYVSLMVDDNNVLKQYGRILAQFYFIMWSDCKFSMLFGNGDKAVHQVKSSTSRVSKFPIFLGNDVKALQPCKLRYKRDGKFSMLSGNDVKAVQ